MRKLLFIAFFSSLTIAASFSQEKEKVSIKENVTVESTVDLAWVTRFEKQICDLEESDRKKDDFNVDILFIGSSSARLWKTFAEDMSPLKTENRGYGGSSIRDQLYNFDRVTARYNPKNVLIYIENDVSGKPENVRVGEIYKFFCAYVQRLRAKYSSAEIYLMAFKPSRKRAEVSLRQKEINGLLEEFAQVTPKVNYIDVASPLLDAAGNIVDANYVKDNLHLSPTGYKIWREIVRKALNLP